MPAKPKRAEKELSWDEIGKAIGRKMEKFKKEEEPSWAFRYWGYNKNGGGFGRFLFIIGVLYALQYGGMLPSMPWWVYVLLVLGFTLMRF